MPELTAYQRVARELRERVFDGTYPPGTKMPSLRQVEAEFGISRFISRSAYQVLIGEGLVEGRFGGGYYVRSYRPIIRHGIQRLASTARAAGRSIWDADPGTAGRALVVDQIQISTEEPAGDIANELGLEIGARTVVRRRRYVLDGKPVLHSTNPDRAGRHRTRRGLRAPRRCWRASCVVPGGRHRTHAEPGRNDAAPAARWLSGPCHPPGGLGSDWARIGSQHHGCRRGILRAAVPLGGRSTRVIG
jgi:DNA-binding transcriptional regulator YhcF (GntR family)